MDDKRKAKYEKMVEKINREVPEANRAQFLQMAAALRDGKENPFKDYKTIPVDIKQFIESPAFMNAGAAVYPKIMKELIEINSGKYVECILTGGIGSGKTSIALYTTAYQLYLISCLKSPQIMYGLDPASEIIFIFQNITAKLAKDVDFARFKSMIESSPYFRKHFMFDKNIESKLVFPHNIRVVPVSGEETAAIGQNVISGLIDELNYMAITESSKKSIDGEAYNQAIKVYNSIARRRKSRFSASGMLPGILCLASSKRYPGQFTDVKEEEARSDPTIYVYDKRVWEITPDDTFNTGTFTLFFGDEFRNPKLVDDRSEIPIRDHHLLLEVPNEFKQDFIRDITDATREIAGKSTLASHPYITDIEIIDGAFNDEQLSILSRNTVDFFETQIEIYPRRFVKPNMPRWVHIDLAITGDSAGVACGFVPSFVEVERGDITPEILPQIRMDFTLEVQPPRHGEINFSKIRALLIKLKEHGLNIKYVSLDSYQCIADDTEIWTSRGLLRADQVAEGDIVQSRSGPNKVTKVFSYGNRDTIKIRIKSGATLEMTRKHKIEVSTLVHDDPGHIITEKTPWSWCEAGDLRIGDVVRYWSEDTQVDTDYYPMKPQSFNVNANEYTFPEILTEDWAEFVGIVYGDGNLHKDGVHISCTEEDADDIYEVILRLFPYATKRGKENHSVVSVSSRSLTRWFIDNDLDKSEEIPEAVKRSPLRVQAAFIRGLFSTDGNVSKEDGASSFSTIHILWAEYIQKLLCMGFGIHSHITRIDRLKYLGYGTSRRWQYVLSVRGSRRKFYEDIGYCVERKLGYLEDNLSRKGRFIHSRIVSMTESNAPVYDFEVENDHSYLANGFVSHNSRDTMQILRSKGFQTGYVSVDRTTDAYDTTKGALADGRISMPTHKKLRKELASLERDVKRGKIDHPPSLGSSKDISDALAGVVFGLTMRKEIWLLHNVSLSKVPNSIKCLTVTVKTEGPDE